MALTVSFARHHAGSQRLHMGTVAFDSSYPTGGESLTPANVGLHAINSIEFTPTSGYVFEYDYSNQKVLVYRSAGFTPAGTIGAHTHDILVIGGQAAAGTDTVQAAVGDVILGKEEAANATIAGANSATKGGVVSATTTFTGTAVSAGVLVEVSNATNLSALTGVRFRAYGV